MFPFEECFHLGKQKTVAQGEIRWTGRAGHGGHDSLGQKLLNSQHSVDGCVCKSPTMKWEDMMEEPSKNIH